MGDLKDAAAMAELDAASEMGEITEEQPVMAMLQDELSTVKSEHADMVRRSIQLRSRARLATATEKVAVEKELNELSVAVEAKKAEVLSIQRSLADFVACQGGDGGAHSPAFPAAASVASTRPARDRASVAPGKLYRPPAELPFVDISVVADDVDNFLDKCERVLRGHGIPEAQWPRLFLGRFYQDNLAKQYQSRLFRAGTPEATWAAVISFFRSLFPKRNRLFEYHRRFIELRQLPGQLVSAFNVEFLLAADKATFALDTQSAVAQYVLSLLPEVRAAVIAALLADERAAAGRGFPVLPRSLGQVQALAIECGGVLPGPLAAPAFGERPWPLGARGVGDASGGVTGDRGSRGQQQAGPANVWGPGLGPLAREGRLDSLKGPDTGSLARGGPLSGAGVARGAAAAARSVPESGPVCWTCGEKGHVRGVCPWGGTGAPAKRPVAAAAAAVGSAAAATAAGGPVRLRGLRVAQPEAKAVDVWPEAAAAATKPVCIGRRRDVESWMSPEEFERVGQEDLWMRTGGAYGVPPPEDPGGDEADGAGSGPESGE